jgi:histidyl-tRNA synthetase
MFKPRDEQHTTPLHYTTYEYRGPFSRAISIANHYGFSLVKPLQTACVQELDEDFLDDEYKSVSAKTFSNYVREGSPFLACHTRNPRRKQGSIALEVHGSSSSVAEALTLKAALSILKDRGPKSYEIELNSIGDADARLRFKKHYVDFLKKQISRIPAEYQAELRQNPFLLHRMAERDEFLREIAEDAPWSLNYLSDHDRRHLKEVVEYIEDMGVPYRINPSLIGNPDSCSHTFFRITHTGKKGKITLACGERFEYPPTSHFRKPSVSISVRLNGGQHESYKEKKATPSPKVYFVHLGPEAKRKGFEVLDILRESRIPCAQNIVRDSMTEQMIYAENSHAPHLVIMGIKEAQENSVIVRNVATRAQETIEIPALRTYLRTVVK